MNAAMKICQANFDAKLPTPVSSTPQEDARTDWLYDSAGCLIRGGDVTFQRRMHSAQGVSSKQFALAVDEHVNGRLADCRIDRPSLGYLIIAAMSGQHDKVAAYELLGHSNHVLGKLGEIAQSLLEPLADDALEAQAKDDER